MKPNTIIVEAEKNVAMDSPDHLHPWGTRRDNSENRLFNEKIYRLYPHPSTGVLRVLDMGCSGGGFVRSLIDDGCLAIGLEGSDYSKKHQRCEWRHIPDFLFTCDVTGEFNVFEKTESDKKRIAFDVITSWELIEHLPESALPVIADNVRRHLAEDGLWIMSVSSSDDIIDGVNLHQTVKPREWWIDFFSKMGFEHIQDYVDYFNTQFVRGPKYGAEESFHLVLSHNKDRAPKIPDLGVREKLYDRWMGSAQQRRVSRWVTGQ